MSKQFLVVMFALLLFVAPGLVLAGTYVISPNSDIIGEMQKYTVQKGDDFGSVARKFDLGWEELARANPKINPHKKLAAGTELLIPTEFILPTARREGIVLNLAEMRIYYYEPNSDVVVTHPVGIGQQGWRTPTGETIIATKRPNPTWTPPPSIRREAAARGRTLPKVVAAGPRNPLGAYAMNLGIHGYLMHGTNAPSSIGQRSSHGCIRMYAEDIEDIFHRVHVGTPVQLVHEPYKVGVKDDDLYLEAHAPFPDKYYNSSNQSEDQMLQEAVQNNQYHMQENIDWHEAMHSIEQKYGYPVLITIVHE